MFIAYSYDADLNKVYTKWSGDEQIQCSDISSNDNNIMVTLMSAHSANHC